MKRNDTTSSHKLEITHTQKRRSTGELEKTHAKTKRRKAKAKAKFQRASPVPALTA